MKCIKIEPHKRPEVVDIDSSLKSLQEAVGGYIEAIYPWEDEVALICNEEGKLEGLPLNRTLYDERGHMYDIVAGTFLLVGLTHDNFGDLSADLTRKYMKEFECPESFVNLNGHIITIREDAQ